MASGKRGETISRGPQRYADSSYSRTHAARRGRGRRLLLGGAAFLTAAAWAVLAYAPSLPGVPASATAVLRPLSAPTLIDRTAAPPPTLDLPSMYALPVAVAVQFDATLNAGDVDGTLALFEPGAQVKVPPDLYVGQAQIRNWVSYLAANHFAAEPGLRHLDGTTVTWPAEVRSDQLARLGLGSLQGGATLVVRGARITGYTFVLRRESAAQLRSAQLAAAEVLQDPLVVAVESANIYGATDVFRTTDGTLVNYRDVVGAEPGSGPFYDLGGEPIVICTGF